TVWRGPRAKYQVTLSVRPSMWQAAHEPQAAPASDQRARPVVNRRLPWRAEAPGVPAIGSAVDGGPRKSVCREVAATSWVLRSTAVTSRVPSSATKPNPLFLLMARPMGRWMPWPVATGVRTSMKLPLAGVLALAAAPTLLIWPLPIV